MFDVDGFTEQGIVALPGAFTQEEAARMRSTIWSDLEARTEVRQHDPATWPAGGGGDINLKSLKGLDVFTPVVANRTLRDVLDQLLGPQRWKKPKRGPRLLLTFPNPGRWVLPSGWHFGGSFVRDTTPIPWVQLWAFIDRVDPCGGGTLLLTGSHRLVEAYGRDLPDGYRPGNGVNWSRFMEHYPQLDALRRGGTAEDPCREVLNERLDVDGVPVQAIELRGEPGDLFISHGHTFHAASPNTSRRPRLMMAGKIHPA